MSIGILYESNEWSDYALRDNISDMGVETKLINMQQKIDEDTLLSCDLVISRIFASAVFRGHRFALDQMPYVIDLLNKSDIPMINPAEAHQYEISKKLQAEKLKEHGFPVPDIYGAFTPALISANPPHILDFDIKYPCIIKPDCGGRTIYTFIAGNESEFLYNLKALSVKEDTHNGILKDKQKSSIETTLDISFMGTHDASFIGTQDTSLKGTQDTNLKGTQDTSLKGTQDANINELSDISFIAEEYIYPEYGFITRIEVIDEKCRLIMKRSIAENGLSTYHFGSTYEHYKNCPQEITDTAIRAMALLSIEAGSLDIIENRRGFFIIDINSVSNVSEDNTEMFDFDLMKETAAFAHRKFNLITSMMHRE